MTNLIKKIAAMAAAVMMMGTMSIGASASGIIIDRDPAPYVSKYMRMACEGHIYTGSYKRRVFNLTNSRSSTKRYFYARVQILNGSYKLIKQDAQGKILNYGNILAPDITLTNKNSTFGICYSEVRKTTNSKSTIIDDNQTPISLKY